MLKKQAPGETILKVGGMLLLFLGVLLAFGSGTTVGCGILTAGLAAAAVAFMVIPAKAAGRKRFLRGLGLALIPGVLAAAAALVLCLI